MPIYEYRCRQCGSKFERIQKHSDAPVTTCAECSGPVEKLVSRSGFQLKGTGWYVTDYARKGGAGNADGGKSESGKSESGKSESGKSESGKSESGKSESGKSESGKSESGKSESGKSESGKSESGKSESGKSESKGESAPASGDARPAATAGKS